MLDAGSSVVVPSIRPDDSPVVRDPQVTLIVASYSLLWSSQLLTISGMMVKSNCKPTRLVIECVGQRT